MSLFKKVNWKRKEIKPQKVVGRGYGSGKGGHTTGRGQKGQKSRGHNIVKLGYAGGQTPLHLAIPKLRGLRRGPNPKKKFVFPLGLKVLEMYYKEGETVSRNTLISKGIIKKSVSNIKVLTNGELTHKLVFKNIEFSAKALEKVKKIGCEIINEEN